MIIKDSRLTNKNPEFVEILSDDPIKFQCKTCGQTWYPEWSPSSARKELPFECWLCPNGCGQEKEINNHEEENEEQDNPLII